MKLSAKLTPEQYNAVYNAPFAAATYVGLASGDVIDFVKEMAIAGKFIHDEIEQGGVSGYGTVVDQVLAAINDTSGGNQQPEVARYQGSNDAEMRAKARAVVVAAAEAVSALPSATGYKIWLMAIAQATALTKTGGFLGMGGATEIDAKEREALNELAGVLGLPAM